MSPKLSICVPNLNTLPFLPERFETIFKQSFQDWELLVYDSYSDDGSWEYIQQLAAHEKRMRIWQGPRQGTPGSWNPVIQAASGKYIYVATSDDTMAPDCLEKLVAALDEHEDCGLAHCPLIHIDETGAPLQHQVWPKETVFGQSTGELVNHPHVRRAPYDGLLQLTGQHIYLSFTQLLIRRSLFSQVGPLQSCWGSSGDFNWYMRAGLVSNTVHVPDTWATLRVHSGAATSAVPFNTPKYYGLIEDMIFDAVNASEGHLQPLVAAALKSHWMEHARDMRVYYTALRHRRSVLSRRWYQLAQVFVGGPAVHSELLGQLLRRPKWGDVATTKIRHWLESLGLGPMIVPLSVQASDQFDNLEGRMIEEPTKSNLQPSM